MANPTKVAVIESLKALGVEVNPEAPYNELVSQLKDLQGQESVPEKLKPPVKEADFDERLKSPTQTFSQEDEDYLRKYQYRKQTALGSVESDPQAGSKAEIMKKILLKQPKIRMYIPREQGEDSSIKLSVTLNGYRLDFPKQTYVEVPLQIAEVIASSQKQTDAAILRGQINESKEKQNALL